MPKIHSHNYNYVSSCPVSPSASTCTLINRQQPIHARISTNNEKDRRPIDPPPIIQIRLNNASPQQTDSFHQNSYFFMCANLVHPEDDNEIYTPTHNALSGQIVSSMYKLKDVNDLDGAFFIFGDLSVKVEGCFRLKLSLFEITLTGAVCLNSIFTDPFIVYSAKRFPGVLESTFLSRSFSDQGARIRLRKESRAQAPGCNKRNYSALSNEPELSSVPHQKHTAPSYSSYASAWQSPAIAGSTWLPAQQQQQQQDQHEVSTPTEPYYQRRSSLASNTTDGSSTGSEGSSPVMPSLHTHAPNFHFSTGTQGNAKSLVSQQLYDPKFSTQTYYGETDNMSPPSISRDLRCHHEIIQLPPPPTVLSKQTAYPKLDIELPPLRNIVPCNNNKRARTNSIETNAVIAMMQLSQNSHKEYAGSY